MLTHDTFETFKKDVFAFIVDKFLHEIFIDNKFTQDILDTLMLVEHVLILFVVRMYRIVLYQHTDV